MIHRSCWLKSKKLCYSCVLKEANQSTPPSTTEAEQEEEPNKSKVVTAKATGGRRSTSYKKGSKDQIAPADVAEMIATENENGVVAGVAGGEKKTFQANTNPPENPSSAVEGGGELVPDIQFGGTEANDTAASAVSHTPKSKTTTAAGNIEKKVPLVAPFSTMREKVSNIKKVRNRVRRGLYAQDIFSDITGFVVRFEAFFCVVFSYWGGPPLCGFL